LEELSRYLRKPKKEIEKKMLVEKPVAEAWKKMNPNPNIEREVENFYIKTDAYIFELMAANNIVQTLYSFYVLCEKLNSLNVRTILDYGAGAGTLSILFKNIGYDVVYADLPGKLFSFAKWRLEKRKLRIPMIDLNKEKVKIKYDCIVCTEVIEHVANPKALLKIFRDGLKKNDILVISESCEYTENFSSHLEKNKKYGGKNFIKLMKSFGFEQIIPEPFIPQMIFRRK
jgi:SAM-dependent methyltransferase